MDRREIIEQTVIGLRPYDFQRNETPNTIPARRDPLAKLKEKQINNYIRLKAPDCKAADFVVFCDDTFFGSGKSGILFSIDGLYADFLNVDREDDPVPIPVRYDDLISVYKPLDGTMDLILTYRDGRKEKVFGSLYACFLAHALNGILRGLRREVGNSAEYDLENVKEYRASALRGKKVVFLGSSVTAGSGADDVSFADYLARRDGVVIVKEAVSGTTLVTRDRLSYIPRLNDMEEEDCQGVDAFVCQLSTNDASLGLRLGDPENEEDGEPDETTVFGAIETIIQTARERWNCPIAFYTNTRFSSERYQAMVDLLLQNKEKWNITVIDLWNDDALNAEIRKNGERYMLDEIHPMKSGYLKLWLPRFEKALEEMLK